MARPHSHCYPGGCTGVADDSIANWFMAILVYPSRCPWPVGFCSEGGSCLVGRSLWLVAAALLATADLSLFPDACSLWKCLSIGSSSTMTHPCSLLSGWQPPARELSGPRYEG
jgi:hypothetical protein